MPEAFLSLIPQPQHVQYTGGTCCIETAFSITAENDSALPSARLLESCVSGPRFHLRHPDNRSTRIMIAADGRTEYDSAGFCDESYRLEISEKGIRLSALGSEGLVPGVQTIRQIIMTNREIPCCIIEDRPRFRWRGVHLDVSRHFFPVSDIEHFIDSAAFHKLNRLHLHLSDDQGWRFEVKKYPRLTETGSVRPQTLVGHYNDTPRHYDRTVHKGFYTQEELSRLVDYALCRGIVIVPEIDMPGHMQAAIAAYPEWGCTDEKVGVRELWGISQHILNVEPSTIQAMKDILSELMEIFPSRFIHIGGDEAMKLLWEQDKQVQKRMSEYGCRNEQELQSWFIRQMDTHITEYGRRSIGWDEILEGSLAQDTAVMSWRGEQGGIRAATCGHDVVMAPQEYTYFDHYQDIPPAGGPPAIGGHTPLEKVYAYEPVPASLPPEFSHHILGSQAQLWTEYIEDKNRLYYMAYPRLCALAEVLWSNKTESGKKNYKDFLSRLKTHRMRLERQGIHANPLP